MKKTTKKTPTKKKSTTKKTTTKKKTTKRKTTKKTTIKKKTTTAKKKSAKKKSTKKAKKKTTKKARSKTQPIVDLQRVRILADGSVQVAMRCPGYRTRACGASGTAVAGTTLGETIPDTKLSFTITAAVVPVGKTLVRTFKLTTEQLAELSTLSEVNFRVRLSIAATAKRVNEVFVHASVPPGLRADAATG
jgi:hypothetical protein